MNVLVIGAGPVGLTAALDLATRGISCRIVEKRAEPSKLSKAVGIMPETIEKLRRLGAGDAIAAEAMALRKITFKHGSRLLFCMENAKYEKVMLGLPQSRTEEILRDALRARGVSLEYDLSVQEISSGVDTATVTFSDGATATYDWVIAADGAHSTVRERLGIGFPGLELPEEWSIADVEVSGPFDAENVTAYCQGPGNVLVMVLPIENQRVRIVSSTSDALAALPEPLTIQRVHRTGTFAISIRQADTYRQGRVLLAGDAAHCHSPVGGRGMNLGIDDAVAAVAAIVNGTTDQYTAQRHALAVSIIRQSELLRKLVTSNNGIIRLGTTVAFRMIALLPFLQKALMRRLTQLKVR